MTFLDRIRQAGAAARLKGLSQFDNPFEAAREMPPETGEEPDKWFAKFMGWRAGREQAPVLPEPQK